MPFVILAGSLLVACASTPPPTGELAAAARSVENARAAGASNYASPELDLADQRLGEAHAAETAQDYDGAARLALEAQASADLAVARSHLGKARDAVQALKQQNAALQQDLDSGNGGQQQ
ncbi:MAG: DUF4398 domain-containing protein [Rhodanobacteraceae bacterium]